MKYLLTLASLLLCNQLMAEPVLVDTDWLAKNAGQRNLIIVDTSDQTQYLRFHLPGAIHIDYNDIVYQRKPDKVSVQVPNDYFIKLLAQRGISNDSYIVIYDDMGGLNAGRLFWQLEQIGHQKVSVLDGGLVKWILEHRKVSNQPTQLLPVVYQDNKTGHRDNLATLSSLNNKPALLIDARSKDEYIGHPKYPRSGHVPGALLWDWQENVNFEQGFILKSAQQITKDQKHINLNNKQQEIIAYCQSGHRASQTYLTLRSMGYDKVKLYDGSMAEYGSDKTTPLEQGCTGC